MGFVGESLGGDPKTKKISLALLPIAACSVAYHSTTTEYIAAETLNFVCIRHR